MFEIHFLRLQFLPTLVRASWNFVQIQQNHAYFNLFRAILRANAYIESQNCFENAKTLIGRYTVNLVSARSARAEELRVFENVEKYFQNNT